MSPSTVSLKRASTVRSFDRHSAYSTIRLECLSRHSRSYFMNPACFLICTYILYPATDIDPVPMLFFVFRRKQKQAPYTNQLECFILLRFPSAPEQYFYSCSLDIPRCSKPGQKIQILLIDCSPGKDPYFHRYHLKKNTHVHYKPKLTLYLFPEVLPQVN